MANFAKLDESNVVLNIHRVDNQSIIKNGVENEDVGSAYLERVHGWPKWKQTSYNTSGGKHYTVTKGGFETDAETGDVYQLPSTIVENDDQSQAFRKNHAEVGGTYDESRDAFLAARPYASWTLNETTCQWEPPTPMPDTFNTDSNGERVGDVYHWNESTQAWDKEPRPDIP